MAKTKESNATELHKPIRNRKPKASVLAGSVVAADATELRVLTADAGCKTNNKNVLTPKAERLARVQHLESIGIDAIMDRVAVSSFRDVAAWAGVPTMGLWAWIRNDPERRQMYEAAVEAKAHVHVDDAHALADRVAAGDMDPRQAETKIKMSQWSAGRTQAYQERKTVEHTVTHKLDLDDLKSRLGQLVDVAANRVIEGECTTIAPSEAG